MSESYSIFNAIIGFLGGGIVGAIINWIHANQVKKKERKITFLDDQIRNLYGPLYYLVSQASKLFELNDRFHEAYDTVYVNQKFSQRESTQKTIREETQQTLDIANKYIAEVTRVSDRIYEVLDGNYPLVDPNDIDAFIVFYEHYVRYKTEIDEQGRTKTPFRIFDKIGNISFLRKEFMDRVNDKFTKKKLELNRLIGNKTSE